MSTDDQLAECVLEAHARFEMALHSKGPFPEDEFEPFFQAVWRYAMAMKEQKRLFLF